MDRKKRKERYEANEHTIQFILFLCDYAQRTGTWSDLCRGNTTLKFPGTQLSLPPQQAYSAISAVSCFNLLLVFSAFSTVCLQGGTMFRAAVKQTIIFMLNWFNLFQFFLLHYSTHLQLLALSLKAGSHVR